jgi:hypothetical protein
MEGNLAAARSNSVKRLTEKDFTEKPHEETTATCAVNDHEMTVM